MLQTHPLVRCLIRRRRPPVRPHHNTAERRNRGPGCRRMVSEESVILNTTEALVENRMRENSP